MKQIPRIISLLLVAAFALVGTGCYSSPDNGKISVVRGDGFIEGRSGIKSIICPGDKKFVFNDETHEYPDSTSQRTYKFNTDNDADTGPIEGLRTKDGYKVDLAGTIFFKTAFNCDSERGKELLKEFDKANASRPEGQRPWEDFPGWLNNQWKPILDRTARNTILNFNAQEVLSSAGLLTESATVKADDANNQSNIAKIENALRDGLVTQLNDVLGDDYFVDITFNMEQPFLPDIDGPIKQAQAALGGAAEARAERLRQQELVEVEKQKRLVAIEKQKGYASCPSCARQDEFRALPDGLTTYAPGAAFAVK